MKKLIRCSTSNSGASSEFQKMQSYLNNSTYSNNLQVIRMRPAETDSYGDSYEDSFIVQINNDEKEPCGYINYNAGDKPNKVFYSLYNAVNKSANLPLFLHHIDRYTFAAEVFEDYFNYKA